MKTFLIRVILMLASVALSFYLPVCHVNGESNFEVRPLSFKEIDVFYKNGSLMDYFNATYQKLNETNQKLEETNQKLKETERVANISGFLCSCLLIRDLLKYEYQLAEQLHPGGSCHNTWLLYIRNSERPIAIELRNSFNASDDEPCGYALCNAKYIANEHVHYSPGTVRVAMKLHDGTKDTILQILERERPKFLFTVREMRFVNIFVKAAGHAPFPFETLVRGRYEYAIPQVRSPSDLQTCPILFSENDSSSSVSIY